VNPGTDETPAPKVFICYRREDTAAHAGRLYDAMVNRFGERNVFMDVDMAPGVDFVERITEVVSACQVLIVVMGPNWATVTDEDGEARITDPDDFVRLEVETALRRPDVTPIPALVSEARMPKREQLPAELRPLTRRNALELSNSRWGYDVERLHTTLDELLTDMTRDRETMAPAAPAPELATPVPTEAPTPLPPVPDPPAPNRGASGVRLVLEGILVAAFAAYLARWLVDVIPQPKDDPGALASLILRRAGTWGLTGAALAVWLAFRRGQTDLLRFGLIGLIVGAIGGAVGAVVWGLPVILPDPNLDKVDLAAANRIEIGSLTVTGGFVGGLIGWLWEPQRLGAGLAAGAFAGALFQLAAIATGHFDKAKPPVTEVVVAFALTAATIAGLTLATLIALDARRAGAALPAPARGP
jgi:hypothetical protein